MIRYLTRDQIDVNKWEKCIASIIEVPIYFRTSFLDALPDEWNAVVVKDDKDEYTTVFPFQVNRKMGFKILKLNPFLPYTDVYSVDKDMSADQIDLILLEAFKQFSIVENLTLSKLHRFQFPINEHKIILNSVLDISPGYQSIIKHFSENRNRDLAKALKAGLIYTEETDLEKFIALHNEFIRPKIYGLKQSQYNQLKNIFQICQHDQKAFIANVYSQQLLSSAVILVDKETLIYYAAASSDDAKNMGASTFLINEIIKKYGGKFKTLDFKGGDLPGLERFYSSFGAISLKRSSVTVYNLTGPGLIAFNMRRAVIQLIKRFLTFFMP